MNPENVVTETRHAEQWIRPYIRKTLLSPSLWLSDLMSARVFCKLENLQVTGSFKARGAVNKLLSLNHSQQQKGVVTASTGNHGAGVAYGMSELKIPGIIFVPETTMAGKIEMITRMGVELRYHGTDNVETEIFARRYAEEHDMIYVSPYNDPQVIGGQGTIGLELVEQLKKIDYVFVSLGGGGLISGIAGYLKSLLPNTIIVGCSPENSQVMIKSQQAGEVLDLPSEPTLSDGTAGGIEPGCITFDLCRSLVDVYLTVSENEIKQHLKDFINNGHMLIEGSAAVAVAGLTNHKKAVSGKNAVVIICGANIALDVLKSI